MPFNMFPYSNLHNLNLDWILNTVKTMAAAVEAAATTVETYAARLRKVETDIQAITPAANGAVRHDVSQSLDTANRRRAAVNIHAVSYDTVLLSPDEKAQARSNIGAAASEAIPDVSDVVRTSAQSFTDAQKTQARTNIGAAAAGAIPDVSDVVRVTAQTFTSAEQRTACGNIKAVSYNTQSASPADRTVARANLHAVGYEAQTLTETEKTQARTNIGALGSSDIPAPEGAVLYTAQTLTDGQKQQARTNIGALGSSDVSDVVRTSAQTLTDGQKQQARTNIQAEIEQIHMTISNPSENVYTTSADFDEVVWAAAHNIPVWIYLTPYGEAVTYVGCARLTNTAQGYESIGATLTFTRQAANSFVPETWYNVSWLDGNPAPVLTVTTYQGRMVPNPTSNDAGKALTVNNMGVPVWTTPAGPLVVTFSGTSANNNASCDKTWAEINAAGTNIELWYQQQYSKTKLVPVIYQNSAVYGEFTHISDPTDVAGGYTSIACGIHSTGKTECTIVDG